MSTNQVKIYQVSFKRLRTAAGLVVGVVNEHDRGYEFNYQTA